MLTYRSALISTVTSSKGFSASQASLSISHTSRDEVSRLRLIRARVATMASFCWTKRFNMQNADFHLVTASCFSLRSWRTICCCADRKRSAATVLRWKYFTVFLTLSTTGWTAVRLSLTTKFIAWAKHGKCIHPTILIAALTLAALSVTQGTTLSEKLHSAATLVSSCARLSAVCLTWNTKRSSKMADIKFLVNEMACYSHVAVRCQWYSQLSDTQQIHGTPFS